MQDGGDVIFTSTEEACDDDITLALTEEAQDDDSTFWHVLKLSCFVQCYTLPGRSKMSTKI